MSVALAQEAEVQKEAAGGVWRENSAHPVSDWQYEVANGDTKLGYWEWVVCQLEQAEDAEDD